MRAFSSANAWLDPANTMTVATVETRNRTRRGCMTAAHRWIAELGSGALHAGCDVGGGSEPSTAWAVKSEYWARSQTLFGNGGLRNSVSSHPGNWDTRNRVSLTYIPKRSLGTRARPATRLANLSGVVSPTFEGIQEHDLTCR